MALSDLARSVQFYWFVGHVLAFSGGLFYGLFNFRLLFKSPSFPLFWYRLSYGATVATFSVSLSQAYKKPRSATVQTLLRDDNVHYLLLAIMWLVSKPQLMTLPPFMIFSLFHVLTYTRSFLLPALGHGPDSPLSAQINAFVKKYNDPFMSVAATSEFFTLLRLLAAVFTFRRAAVIQLVFYLMFFKLRFDSSVYTRTVVKNWEVRVDGLASHPSLPPVVKQAWLSVKGAIKQAFGLLNLAPPKPVKKTQ